VLVEEAIEKHSSLQRYFAAKGDKKIFVSEYNETFTIESREQNNI
jgi:hypothetical protein